MAFLLTVLYLSRKLKALREDRQRVALMRKLLTCMLPVLFMLALALMPAFTVAKPPSEQRGESNVAHVLLVTKTEDWVSIWPGAFGYVKYSVEGDKFEGIINAHKLKPNTEYVLCINGPGGTATDSLIAQVALTDNEYPSGDGTVSWDGWWPGADGILDTEDDEGYFDFAVVTTNNGGSFHYEFSASLLPGDYVWVKFLVKDTSAGWKVVLMEDVALSFAITS